jgi:hypothetical protein
MIPEFGFDDPGANLHKVNTISSQLAAERVVDGVEGRL